LARGLRCSRLDGTTAPRIHTVLYVVVPGALTSVISCHPYNGPARQALFFYFTHWKKPKLREQ
jgi:hypothetical protein